MNMEVRRKLAGYAAIAILLWPFAIQAQTTSTTEVVTPEPVSTSTKPYVSAIVMDADTKKVLFEDNADKVWSAASLTKLMTAMVFLQYRPSWNKVVSIKSVDEVGGGRLRVNSGATMSVKDLMYSAISASANNAAMALTRVTGLKRSTFVSYMNKKALALGLKKTHFVEPSGMDPKNVTTAREMAMLARTAFTINDIRLPATTASYRFTIRNTKEIKTLKNTNDLLIANEYEDVYVTGGKTGFLYESMYNLAVRLKPTDTTKKLPNLMIVVFGAPSRAASFASAKTLADQAWQEYR